jgi:hypothetical protein
MTFHTETANDLLEVEPRLAPRPAKSFVVIHPLHDAPEAKCDAGHLGPLKLSRGCRIALGAVRFYIIAILLLGGYRVVELIRHAS